MIEAAVTKVATTAAPAMVEGAAATASAIPAAMKGAEALQAAVATSEIVQGGAEAAEVGIKAAEATPEAAQAAIRIDSALAQGAAVPEVTMRDLVASPATGAETAAEDTTLAVQRQEEIQQAVQPQMAQWDKSNPPGKDIQGWIERRVAAEKQYTVNEGVSRDLAKWKEQNPPPDKDKNPDDYAKWEKRLAERGTESHRSNEASYDQLQREQEEKRQGMNREEFMRRYAELLQLRTVADQLAMRLQTLRASSHQTTMRKEVLSRAEAQLEIMRTDIATREAELQLDAISSRSIWKQFIIPAVIGVSMVAGPMAASANEGIA